MDRCGDKTLIHLMMSEGSYLKVWEATSATVEGDRLMLRNKTSRERYESLAMGPASRTLRSKLASKTP